MNSDGVCHIKLPHSPITIIMHVTDCSVQSENGTRTPELTVIPYHTQLVLMFFMSTYYGLLNSW